MIPCGSRGILPVAHVDDVTGPGVLFLHLASQVHAAHGHQVGLVGVHADALKEAVVQDAGRGHGHRAHPQLHPCREDRQQRLVERELTSQSPDRSSGPVGLWL